MPTTTEVYEFLESLGPTSGTVAQSLRDLGIKGYPGACSECPIARAVKKKFSIYSHDLSVGPTSIQWLEDGWEYVATPAAVSKFIGNFDNMMYEDLRETKPLRESYSE